MAGMTKHPPRPTEADRASRLFRMLNEGGGSCGATGNSCPSNFAGGNNNFCNDVQRECLACASHRSRIVSDTHSLTHMPSCCGDSLWCCYALLFCVCLCHYFLLLLLLHFAAVCVCSWLRRLPARHVHRHRNPQAVLGRHLARPQHHWQELRQHLLPGCKWQPCVLLV